MLEILGDGENIDFNKAVASKKSVVEDPTRKELRSKKLYEMPATYRRAHVRFLKTGMLLPFGQPVGGFDIPNPYVHMLGLGRKNGLD